MFISISLGERRSLIRDTEATLRDYFEEGKPTEWKFSEAATEIVDNLLASLDITTYWHH